MKRVEYFGNLLNEKINPYPLKQFVAEAMPQGKQCGRYRLYIIDNYYAVAKLEKGAVKDYCLVGNLDEYKRVYTNSKDATDTKEQALYHGVCLLEEVGLGYDL